MPDSINNHRLTYGIAVDVVYHGSPINHICPRNVILENVLLCKVEESYSISDNRRHSTVLPTRPWGMSATIEPD